MKKKITKTRGKSIFAGITLILFILIGGTFAFTMLNQMAFNPDAVGVFSGGRIHDVFQERNCTGVGENRICHDIHGERNKNVFAENFGDMPIGVRVQFREFLALNGIPYYNTDGTVPVPMNINDIYSWGIFQADTELNRLEDSTAGAIGNLGISWQLGHHGGDLMYMPTFNQINRPLSDVMVDPTVASNSIFNNPNAFRFSDVSGRGVDAFADNFYDQTLTSVLDIEEHGVQTGYQNHTGARNFWVANPTHEGTLYYIDEATNTLRATTTTHTARPTETPVTQIGDFLFNGVMSLEQWIDLDRFFVKCCG